MPTNQKTKTGSYPTSLQNSPEVMSVGDCLMTAHMKVTEIRKHINDIAERLGVLIPPTVDECPSSSAMPGRAADLVNSLEGLHEQVQRINIAL